MKKKIGNWDSLEDYVTSKRRLELLSSGVWECEADPPGAMHRWFNPQLFEQICVLDTTLENLYKNYQDTEKHRNKIKNRLRELGRVYLLIVSQKLTPLIPGLADYFEVLYNTGEWEDDKKTYKKYPYDGKEPPTVMSDRFIV